MGPPHMTTLPSMSQSNRQVVLRARPTGLVQDSDVELIEGPVPELGENQALVRTALVGVDAAARTWLDDRPGYLPPVQLGDPVRASTVGEVAEDGPAGVRMVSS